MNVIEGGLYFFKKKLTIFEDPSKLRGPSHCAYCIGQPYCDLRHRMSLYSLIPLASRAVISKMGHMLHRGQFDI